MKCISRSIILLVSLAAEAQASGACALVAGARIHAADLAAVAPAFGAVEPGQDLGPSPSGTMIRIFSRTQLAALLGGDSGGLPLSVCVQRKRDPVPPAVWQAAIEAAVAEICQETPWRAKLLEFPNHPYPGGKLVFTPAGLTASRGREQLWRGSLVLPDNATVPVWVRVEVEARRSARLLRRAVAAGEVLTAQDFAEQEIWAPGVCTAAGGVANPEGMSAKRAMAAGTELRPEHLRRPPAVARGESVELEVRSGVARLRLPAVAGHDADVGDTVELKSGWNGSRLLGRVTGTKTAKLE